MRKLRNAPLPGGKPAGKKIEKTLMIIKVRKNLPKSDDFSFTAIDFERANNCQSSICQIGICVVEKGRITERREYLVKPHSSICYFQPKAVEIHGISYEDVACAPSFAEVWRAVFPYIKGRPLAAHSFVDDAKTLDAALCASRIKYDYRAFGHLCTLELAIKTGIRSADNKYSLEALCGRYGLPLEPHHAGSDAEGCARLALKIAGELSIDSFRRLAELSQEPGFREPDLPCEMTGEDITALEKYIKKLSGKKDVRLSDCPKSKDLGRAKRILNSRPGLTLPKETAESAGALARWLQQAEASAGEGRNGKKTGARTRVRRGYRTQRRADKTQRQ